MLVLYWYDTKITPSIQMIEPSFNYWIWCICFQGSASILEGMKLLKNRCEFLKSKAKNYRFRKVNTYFLYASQFKKLWILGNLPNSSNAEKLIWGTLVIDLFKKFPQLKQLGIEFWGVQPRGTIVDHTIHGMLAISLFIL